MKKLLLILGLFALVVSATAGETCCLWNHQPPAEYEDLPQGIGSWTIAYPFFEDVEGENTLGVDEYGTPYGVMVSVRNSYEAYYDERMSDISDLVDDLDTELSVPTIDLKLSSIHTKLEQIDTAYLGAIQDMHAAMDGEDEDLYDDYLLLLGE